MEKKWIQVADEPPKLAQMAYVFSHNVQVDIAIQAVITKSPFGDDDNLYWHFIHPITQEMMWTCIMAEDKWMPF